MTSPTVLNVIIKAPDDRGGGAVRAGLALGHNLMEYVDVDTVVMDGDHVEEVAAESGLEDVHRIPSYDALRNVSKRVFDFEENFANITVGTRLDPPRSLGDYDVAHIHNPIPLAGMVGAALSCIKAHVPYFVTTHGIGNVPDMPDEMRLSRLQRWLFRQCFMRPYIWVLDHAAHLIALSERDDRRLSEYITSPDVTVIPNGVVPNPPTPKTPDRARRIAGVDPAEPLMLFVGKLRPSKGVSDLLTAYRSVDTDVPLRLAGPVHKESLATEIEAFNGDVEYTGYLPRSQLEVLFRRADLFVFPTRSDVYPLVILEAMAARTPVITTRIGGIPDQVTPNTGILVAPRDPDALATAIEDLLADPPRRGRMARNAERRACEEFSWDQVARQTAQTYTEHTT
jgi:glycosyltransferase involved in cell wall biosynthesis